MSSPNRAQSAAYQKMLVPRRAYQKWAQQWPKEHNKRGYMDSFVYKYALTTPLDKRHHSMWLAAIQKAKDYDLPPISRHTTSTALQLAVGHAFISTYIARFRKGLHPEEQYCPCGWSDRSILHIIYECPCFERQRRDMDGATSWDDIPMGDFFRGVSTAWAFLY